MRRCGHSCLAQSRGWIPLAVLLLASCSRDPPVMMDGAVVLDADLQLVRGARTDTAQRQFEVESDATFVAFVDEQDCNVRLRLESGAADDPHRSFVEVNAGSAEGLEVASLDTRGGRPLTLRLESGQDTDTPCHSRVRLLRYEAAMAERRRVAARLAAFKAWTAATRVDRALEETRKEAMRQLDVALSNLESAEGDRWLAAWARLTRASINNDSDIDLREGARDARRALSGFEQLGDARGAARSRYILAALLNNISVKKTSIDPTAEEATREVQPLLQQLRADPALSELGRANARNFYALFKFNQDKWKEAESEWHSLLDTYRAIGNRPGELMVLHNLGVLAAEVGDFAIATQYFDEVVARLDQVTAPEDRVLYLHGAARADTDAGHVDRAIERLLLALKWNRELHSATLDARIMHALGRAYWARGDIAQASAFVNEALRIRRQIDDPMGVTSTLRYAGTLARESGNIDEALRLHREAEQLVVGVDTRLRAMLELALDYAAIPDHRKAIATCREALAAKNGNPEFYKRYEMQLTLGEMLLDQPKADTAAIAEAKSLAAVPLNAAIRRYDIGMELAARHLLARALAARHQWPQARAEYERAVDLIFKYSSTSTNPELQSSTLAREQATFRGYLDLLMRDAVERGSGELRPATPAENDALRMIEWARATSNSSSRAAALNPESAARIDALLAQMAGKRVRIAALLERDGDTSGDVERLELEIAQLRAETDRIRSQALPATLLSNASLLGAPALPALPANTTQWSYAPGNDHVYLWVRDRDGVRAGVLPPGPLELTRRIAALTANARHGDAEKAEGALKQLEPILVLPKAARDPGNDFEIVAEGSLAGVPFAALRPAGPGTTIMVSSIFESTEPAVPRARSLRFAGVAATATTGDTRSANQPAFPPLSSTFSEARTIATMFERATAGQQVKLLTGNDASPGAIESLWRNGVDVLHVATHGLADLRQPMTSLLMLPAKDASGNPAYLTAGQVQQWRGDANLVYLSACETAVGPARFADGVPGLQRAFLRAGARGVIATLWPIEDVYAGQFATQFYKRYTAGMPADQALAATQRAWLAPVPGINPVEQAHRRLTAWAHVYYTR